MIEKIIGWFVTLFSSVAHGLFPKLLEKRREKKEKDDAGIIKGDDVVIHFIHEEQKPDKTKHTTDITIKGKSIDISQSLANIVSR